MDHVLEVVAPEIEVRKVWRMWECSDSKVKRVWSRLGHERT